MPKVQTALIAAGLAALTPLAGVAQDTASAPPASLEILEARDAALEDFLWTKRVVVVFADTPADPRFAEQMARLDERPRDLVERDVVVLTDTDRSSGSDARSRLRPRGFMFVLIGKDGEVKLRKPAPWSTREISRSIDKMPMRRQEIREGAGRVDG